MARKKIVFVIVEGPSDSTALSLLLSDFFKPYPVKVEVLYRDITTEYGHNPSNIISKVAEVIKVYANNNHLEKVHFQEIIHLVDTDGAYIPDNSVVEDLECEDPVYLTTEIRTYDKLGIEARNKQKRLNLDKLTSTRNIWTIPYRVFYMSCNLDHVLYDVLNSSDSDKRTNAFKFAKKFKNKLPEFIDFISNSDFSVVDGYRESWEYIKQEKRSLERHTNLGLCFAQDDLSE